MNTHSGEFQADDLCRPTAPTGFLTTGSFWMHSTGCVLRWWPGRVEYSTIWEAQ